MNNVGIYTTPKYTAYIYPNKIVICTNMQCFRIEPDRYNQYFLECLALEILKGNIKTVSDLRDYNGALKWINCTKPSLLQA